MKAAFMRLPRSATGIGKVLAFLFTLPILASSTLAAPLYVEVKLIMEYSVRGGSTNAAPGWSKALSSTCIFGRDQWWMTDEYIQRSEHRWLYDGMSVYQSVRLTDPPPTSETSAGRLGFTVVPFERAKSNLTIRIYPSNDGHPLGDPGVNIPWLAFCSGTYLKGEGRLIPLVADMLRHTPDGFGYTDRTETFDDDLGLPKSVQLFSSRELFEASTVAFHSGWGDRYIEWDRRTAAKLEDGVLALDYCVTESTNFLGWNIPLEFRISQKPRPHMQNGNVLYEATGRVESLREVKSMPESVSDPRFDQTIVDYRFKFGRARNSAKIRRIERSPGSSNEPALKQPPTSRD